MTEKQYLEEQSRRIRKRIRNGSVAFHTEIERIIGPTVRDHPRLSLATSASVGLLLGRLLAPTGPARHAPSKGVIGGGLRFVRETGVFALRSLIVGSLLPSTGEDSGPAEDGSSTAANIKG